MTKPKRIQLSRKKGWKKPEGAVVVSRPTKWGNPYKVGLTVYVPGMGRILVRDKKHAVELFRRNVCDLVAGAVYRETAVAELRGKDLACWCKPGEACHGDVLLEIANS